MGKEQGYLTYAEINDQLPDSVTESDQIEDIIQMLSDVGIKIYDVAPDEDDMMLSNDGDDDEIAVDEAAAVLASVESEPGRTTDPVRMYMREMGTVDLLTREGEIAIAKRIEDGVRDVQYAMTFWPGTVELVLKEYQEIFEGEKKVSDIITGFLDAGTDDIEIGEGSDDIQLPVIAKNPLKMKSLMSWTKLQKMKNRLIAMISVMTLKLTIPAVLTLKK